MRRRALLRAAALAGVAGIAGCTTDGPSDGSNGGGDGDDGDGGAGGGSQSPTDDPTDTPTDSPTDSPTDGTSPTPGRNGLVSDSFEMTARNCGQGRNTVDVEFDGKEVRLDGVIDGQNGCYRAEQGAVDYDPEAHRLHVDIRAFEPEDAEMCTQCLVDIEYEARYVFAGEAPDEVTVAHDGRDIASGGHGSSSAGEPTGN